MVGLIVMAHFTRPSPIQPTSNSDSTAYSHMYPFYYYSTSALNYNMLTLFLLLVSPIPHFFLLIIPPTLSTLTHVKTRILCSPMWHPRLRTSPPTPSARTSVKSPHMFSPIRLPPKLNMMSHLLGRDFSPLIRIHLRSRRRREVCCCRLCSCASSCRESIRCSVFVAGGALCGRVLEGTVGW